MNIIARKLTLIQKNPGVRIDYTHVIDFQCNDKGLRIRGESLDSFGLPRTVFDKFDIENLELMIVEFYVPKI